MPAKPAAPIRSPTVAEAIPAALYRGRGSPRRVLAMCAVGALVLAVFASRDLPSWSERLAGLPYAEAAQRLAAEWDDAMEALGLTRPHEALRSALKQALEWR